MANKEKKIVSAPIRMTPELKAKVDHAAARLHMKQAEVLRLALDVGIADLARIDYDLAGVIARAASDPTSPAVARPEAPVERHHPALRVAEESPEYRRTGTHSGE